MATMRSGAYIFNPNVGDEIKAVRMEDLPDDAWQWLVGGPSGEDEAQDALKNVPWLYRAAKLRAQAVGSMPFGIFRGEEEIDTSEEWENTTDLLPNPGRIFALVEMSLIMLGRAYLSRERNMIKEFGLRYLVPSTISPKYDKEKGLSHFERNIGETEPRRMDIQDIVYFWDIDPYKEIGPPDISPATASLAAAGVLMNTDEFAATFFERGAVKATILAVPQGTDRGQKEVLEKWYTRAVQGIKNAFASKVLNADAVTATTIGEGIEGLENTELTKEKREDIAAALGVPGTMLWSSTATGLGGGGVVETDDLRFYRDTIVPECEFIAEVLNEQVFRPEGLILKFKPETLDVFQQDENERAQAYASYVANEIPPGVAAQMLGLELPAGVEYEDLGWIGDEEDEDEQQVPPQLLPFQGGSQTPPPQFDEGNMASAGLQDHLDKWRRKSLKRVRDGREAACKFESEYISPAMNGAIYGALETAETDGDVESVFSDVWVGYP